MSLNNKYLAIGLSIAAVLIVVYQVFINKPQGAQTAKPQPQKPAFVPVAPAQKAASQPTHEAETDNGLVIDFNSPLLLKRIEPDMTLPYPRQELPKEYGADIFSGGGVEAEAPPVEPKYEKVVEFKLNAIIIDAKRRIAIINNTIVKPGDIIEGAVVLSIAKTMVVLKVNNENVVLSTNSRIKEVKLIGGKGAK
jgi:hypothetical protein